MIVKLTVNPDNWLGLCYQMQEAANNGAQLMVDYYCYSCKGQHTGHVLSLHPEYLQAQIHLMERL